MASDLPSEFDVIVLGTGLPESILAAAFSRNGSTVLHLDRNDYYSSNWASFSTDGFEKWKQKNEASQNKETNIKSPDLKEGERKISVPRMPNFVRKIDIQYHIPEKEAKNDGGADDNKADSAEQTEKGQGSSCTGQFDDSKDDQNLTHEKVARTLENQEHPDSKANKEEFSDSNTTQDTTSDPQNSKEKSSGLSATTTEPPEPKQKIWTSSEIKSNWRRFNLDLAPRLLYCSGQMVELLIVSDVAKYCEFRTVSRILTLLNGQLEKVPCSRADVFGSKKVSMLEKRLLMKFLTFCAEYDKHPEQYQDYLGKPFSEFLTSKKLTPNTHHFVHNSIAMATGDTPTEEGLKKTQRFLHSLGRYGNTAFLFPLYGSGEIPQGFCRLCAVFGGVYCLHMSVTDVVLDKDGKCCAVFTTEGQRIECKHLILGPSYIPESFQTVSDKSPEISRAILVTNKSVLPSENSDLSMVHLLPDDDPSRPLSILELPPSSMVCPQDTMVVHLTREGSGDPEKDLSPTIKNLFGGVEQTSEQPCILWSAYFSHFEQSSVAPSDETPPNVYLLPGPGMDLDMDDIVVAVRKVWEKVCPNEDFLPKPPNPEDIIYVDDTETKVGEGTENAFENAAEDEKMDQASKDEAASPSKEPAAEQETTETPGQEEEKCEKDCGIESDKEESKTESELCEKVEDTKIA